MARKQRESIIVEGPAKPQEVIPQPTPPPDPPKKKGHTLPTEAQARKDKDAGYKAAMAGQTMGNYRERSSEWLDGFTEGVFERTKNIQ